MIENIDLLELSPENKRYLEAEAAIYKINNNIEFKIKWVREGGVAIMVRQCRHVSGDYYDKMRLWGVARRLLYDYIEESKVIIPQAFPYLPAQERIGKHNDRMGEEIIKNFNVIERLREIV